MKIKKPYRVKCSRCGEINVLDLDLQCVSSYERNMGPELEHMAIFDDLCIKCSADIRVRVEAWEYPEGNLEDYSVVIEGAEEMEEPEFSIEPPFFDD